MLLSSHFALLCFFLALPGCGRNSQKQEDANRPSGGSVKDVAGDDVAGQDQKRGVVEPITPTRQQVLQQAGNLASKGDFESALPLLQRLLLVNPDDVEVLFQTALMHAGCGIVGSD